VVVGSSKTELGVEEVAGRELSAVVVADPADGGANGSEVALWKVGE